MIRKEEKTGVPDRALEAMPELCPDLLEVWRIFWKCRRPAGFGICHLPSEEIRSALDLHGITDPAIRFEYYRLLRAMDDVFVDLKTDLTESSKQIGSR